ncbi:hypothetical protein N9V05_01870 [Gammaproteobacteria bacterium]|nr:hypothetical protein [Gammaproteobacteria bacterium]
MKIFYIFVSLILISCGGGGGGSSTQDLDQISGTSSGYNVPGSLQPVDTE